MKREERFVLGEERNEVERRKRSNLAERGLSI